MILWWLAAAVGLVIVIGLIVWAVGARRKKGGTRSGGDQKNVVDLNKAYTDIAEEDATHLFNKEFREELRNRGRLRFEKIIDENAMFLKQDLDMTTSQINEYMKQQISAKLDTEFAAYAKAMKEAQELALGSLRKTAQDVEAQRAALSTALEQEVAAREAAILQVYEDNMAKVIEHYVLLALGDQFDLKAQLPYIVRQMEANKAAIMEDMRL